LAEFVYDGGHFFYGVIDFVFRGKQTERTSHFEEAFFTEPTSLQNGPNIGSLITLSI
jgi:hypothetical protein